ncbi:MAG: type VII secretion protein EssC [Firmicutes bacterium]|nr:type VII secretion protein EssC [Bacillota bacterium]
MKLLICDDEKIQSFILPQKVEKFFVINFNYNHNDTSTNETLTLKTENNSWIIMSDSNLDVKKDNSHVETVTLVEYLKLELKFADMQDYLPAFIVPDYYEYETYSTSSLNQIKIGSNSDCQIKLGNLYNESVVFNKTGNDYTIQRIDNRKNSSYVNRLSYSKKLLTLGDTIFIDGIKIIYMGDSLRISKSSINLEISLSKIASSSAIEQKITPVTDLEKNIKLYTDDQVFVHTPRLKRNLSETKITIDPPPQKRESTKMPLIFTIGSTALMSLTSAMTLISSLLSYLKGNGDLMSLIISFTMSAVMLITGLLLPTLMEKWQKKQEIKYEKTRQTKYREYLDEMRKQIQKIITEQENILKENNFKLDDITKDIIETRKNIWSREVFDNDFLSITVGQGNTPALINIEKKQKAFSLDEDDLENLSVDLSNEERILQDVPINYSLMTNRILPIVVHSSFKEDYIKSIMLQLIYYYSAKDVKIVTITNKQNESNWEFMKYVPHSWDNNHENRFFASDEDEISRISMLLEREFENRLKKDQENSFNEYYVIVTDDYKMARELSVIDKILSNQKSLGFSILIFEDSIKNMPSKFDNFVDIENEISCIMGRQSAGEGQILFKASYINNIDIVPYAQIISNIPVYTKSLQTAIPSSISFLELFHAGRVEQLSVLARWKENNPVNSLRTIVGVKDNDKVIDLDLHEKYHGPHGLIAGTTGSGKSEFIITYLLSLAINYHPYEVQFVLIDYKGGGLAGAFENRDTGIKIPHLVGTITNLDKSEMNRTLVSINSELQRRQRVFNETREALEEGTVDIYKYQRFYREGKVKEPMSHLFIVSDEFAELKAQQPDFMDELVSAARIGRSLGVHLILATQKPSGVVDDQIWSNSRFKICLKVQTTDDSQEMLKKPDAAYIKEAGRFYLQVGNDEIFELGQSGWAGAKYVPSDTVVKKLDDSIEFVSNDGSLIKSINEEVKKDESVDRGEQLTNIVKYLYNIAQTENIKFSSLWLENIPPVIYYNDVITKYSIKEKPYIINPIIGEYDDPANQNQGFVNINLTYDGNTYIAGISGSGKTTLLSTIIYSSIINHNSDELNMYIVDFGSEKLRIFKDAPQVGEVLAAADGDKIKYLFYMLMSERDKRLQYYVNNGGDFFMDIKNNTPHFPNTIVIINDIDVFKELYENIYDELFSSFTRNCNKVGITFVVTGTTTNSLGFMSENNFPQKILLNLMDDSDYSSYFSGSPIPKKNPGRGVVNLGAPFEFQSSLVFDETVYDKNIKYVITELNKYLTTKASKIPIVPDELDINDLINNTVGINYVPLGVNFTTAQYSYFNFDRHLTVVTSRNNSVTKLFMPRFISVLSHAKCKLIVIDSINDLGFSNTEGIKYYSTGFAKVLQVINNNVSKYLDNSSDEKFVILFSGYAKLQKELEKAKSEDDEIITIDDLITNGKQSENFRFILYDTESMLRKLDSSTIEPFVRNNSGVWVGKGIDGQEFFDYVSDYNAESKINNSSIVVIKNGSPEYSKYM